MKNAELHGTSNTEVVTISRAEYEELQAQSHRVSALEKHVDILLEALQRRVIVSLHLKSMWTYFWRHCALHGISNLARPRKSVTNPSQSSSVSCSMKRRYLPNPRRKKLPLWLLIRATKSMNTPWTTFRKVCPRRW